MIYITGDTHGDWITRLNKNAFPEQKELTKNDYVIICGDFGIWNDTKEEKYNLKWLEDKPFTTLFICGNHENFNRLYNYPVEEWKGGKIHKINDSVFHLMRGEVFNIEGKRFFAFGGASSHDINDGILEKDDPRIKEWKYRTDKMFRINHVSWWKEELPSQKEMDNGIQNLKKVNNKVDFIITHSPSTSLLKQMDGGTGLYKSDILSDYLEEIMQNTDYYMWFFGHMHINQMFQRERSICLYEQIIRIL